MSSDEPFVQVSRLLASKLRRKVRLEPSLRASQDVLGLLFDKLDTPIDMDALVQLYTRSTSLEMGFGIKLGLSEIESHKETQQLYACVQDLLRLYDTTAEWTVLFPFLRWLLPQRNARRRREAKQVFERFQQAALTLSMQYKDQIMTDQGRFTADSQYHYAKEGLANKLAEIGEPEAVIQGAGVIAAISGEDEATDTVDQSDGAEWAPLFSCRHDHILNPDLLRMHRLRSRIARQDPRRARRSVAQPRQHLDPAVKRRRSRSALHYR